LKTGINLYLYEKERYDQTYMQSRNEMSRITKFEKQNPETYSPMTVKEFLEAKKATEIFSSEEEDDNRFVRQFLMLFKPRA